jgi:hypothetical protein
MPGSLILVKDESLIALCKVTHIESKTHVTVAMTLPLLVLVIILAIIALSYSGPI